MIERTDIRASQNPLVKTIRSLCRLHSPAHPCQDKRHDPTFIDDALTSAQPISGDVCFEPCRRRVRNRAAEEAADHFRIGASLGPRLKKQHYYASDVVLGRNEAMNLKVKQELY